MESAFGRYRNLIVLAGVLFAQILGLAIQVRRTSDGESTRLIRIWAVGTVTPLEKTLSWIQTSCGGLWHNYLYLRGVRAENRELKSEIERMRLEEARVSQDADQAHRLQALLAFKEQYISQTIAAQVVGSSGSEQSRSVYIDKGARDGIKPDMAVLTKDGIVGKVLRVYHSTALVLLVDDQSSGVGCILEKSRLQGILRGTPSGAVVLEKVMSDETVPIGEQVLTSGGDGIFPKGLPVGTVIKVSPGSDLFLTIRVRPAADLNRLEEVLVVTKIDEKLAQPDEAAPIRAVDILAQRLPTVPPKPDAASIPKTASNQGPAPVQPGPQTSGSSQPNLSPAGSPNTPIRKPGPSASQGSSVEREGPSVRSPAMTQSGGTHENGASAAATMKKPSHEITTSPAAVRTPSPKPAGSQDALPPAKPQPTAQDPPQ